MIYKYREEEIYFKFFDRRSDVTNIFLHGWGCDHSSFIFCNKYICASNALFVDFPPFGKSGKIVKDWTVFTYANMVISLCHHLGIKKFNLIGHSFGGRIAIIVSVLCKDETQKLVLIDSAGIKPRRTICYYFKVWAFKLRKKLGMDVSRYGSCDYLALSPNMKRVFNNIVNTHLNDFLPFIKAQTLIVFGEKDKVTPLYMARKLKRNIKDSKLVVLKDAGHFSFVDRKIEFVNLLENFLKEQHIKT